MTLQGDLGLFNVGADVSAVFLDEYVFGTVAQGVIGIKDGLHHNALDACTGWGLSLRLETLSGFIRGQSDDLRVLGQFVEFEHAYLSPLNEESIRRT